MIAKQIVKALFQLKNLNFGENQNISHAHITTKNIFVNLRDMQIQVGDFGLFKLKQFCKLFHGYNMLTNYSAPEIWERHYNPTTVIEDDEDDDNFLNQSMHNPKYDPKVTYYNQSAVDIYSLGFILWELENNQVPFIMENSDDMFSLLTINKVRPKINPDTNKNLALLIRWCWQDNCDKRPTLNKIMESLKLVEFSGK